MGKFLHLFKGNGLDKFQRQVPMVGRCLRYVCVGELGSHHGPRTGPIGSLGTIGTLEKSRTWGLVYNLGIVIKSS